jgi:L-arabinonolactonase
MVEEKIEVVCAAPRRNILGEGPCWDSRAGRLYWVDIHGRLLEWLDPASGETGLWALDRRASAIALRQDGSLLLATEHGFALFDPKAGALEARHNPEPHLPDNRSNDGHTDARGRFWLGTMDDRESAPVGSVYRLDPDWTCTRMITGLSIPNTLVCSPDGKILYVAESKGGLIWAYDFDLDAGTLGERRRFADTNADNCSPDGSAMDAEGCLWNAQWGGWRLVRYRPDGTVDRIIPMPVEQPTSCAFGGENLDTLFITSARDGLSEAALANQPLAGSLFSLDPGVRGAPQALFGG